MLAMRRTRSICAVHFDRLLALAPTNSAAPSESRTSQNAPQNGGAEEALSPNSESTRSNHPHADSTRAFCSNALKISAKCRRLREGKQVHARVVKSGLCSFLSLQNQVLDVYVKCGQYCDARTLFDEIPMKNVVTWNTLICDAAARGADTELFSELVIYFRRMLMESVNPDFLTFNGLLRSCLESDDIQVGRQLHCFIVKYGVGMNCFVSNGLISLYGKCGRVEEARQFFDEVVYRDLAVWNAMFSCYASTFSAEEAFGLFNLMQLAGVKGDEFTFSSLLSCCATSGQWLLIGQIHGLAIRLSFDADILVSSVLVDACGKNGRIDDAHKAFRMTPSKNVVSWNTIIVGYGRVADGLMAMKLLQEMLQKDFHPDELTLASVLSSCGNTSSSSEIMQIHAHTIKSGFESFLSVLNSLINAYSRCGHMDSASKCFSSVDEPDLVTWSTIIRGYGFNGLAKEATEDFEKMLSCGIWPDKIAFLGVISACAHAGMVSKGLHYFYLMINTYRLVPDAEQYASLIDLAARAGLLDEAYDLLTKLPELHAKMLRAFMGACKVYGNKKLVHEAAEMLLSIEPNETVNYSLTSNIYASEGRWTEVARLRKKMTDRCDNKVAGCSWIHLSGHIRAFVSSDKSHPQAFEIYALLGMLLRQLEEDSDSQFCC
ncbi:pentatricopeptide repeat-containing protein At2g46050, mitochondrial [Rhodamnia argentea]|uniref:Pentatricopeptide repeat-containing protein At2g46050, mitochondrial n=1 Tax=Rhodamnia argentea TaxID=178133 RepID=A0ABM3HXF0_9MYRT|nr:pentatricopeptide repeat-containing protein At2g46050, mitochondrial [Rhodamnia argentea]